MPIVYRPAHVDDLKRADELVVGSINELTERRGFGKVASSRPTHFQTFSLKDDPDGLWVADDAGEIAGFAWSWVCADLWFLAQLFVSPARQNEGIGNELIQRSLTHAQNAGATTRALITFTFNNVSQGLYIRHGLFPRFPIYMVTAPRDRLMSRLAEPQLRSRPLTNSAMEIDQLARIDASALSIRRDKHHRYLLSNSGTSGFVLYDGDDCVGYAYISEGHIGPLAVARPNAMRPAFTTALKLAADRAHPNVSAFLPGPSEAALRVATDHGMRITLPMLLMSTRAFGDWASYLPRNPGFM
jgi:ribosomal protein S18 acetylase RimI-like enzyme